MTTGRAGPATSVVVVSYRPGDWLERCLASVRDQTDQLIVVDNGSADGRASNVAAAAGATIVRSPRNLGFAGGVNLGAGHATGAVMVLLNDDAVAPPGWLESLDVLLEDRTVAAVGPKVVLDGVFREIVLPDPVWHAPGDARPLGRQVRSIQVAGEEVIGRAVGAGIHQLEDGDGGSWRWSAGPVPFYIPVSDPGQPVTIEGEAAPPGPVCRLVNSAGTYLRTDGYAGDIGIAVPDDGRLDQAADRFGVSFCAVALRRSAWERVGPLAGPYFAYYEDVDWCWRAHLAGLRVRYEPAWTVQHRHSATSGGVTAPGVRVLTESNRSLSLVRNAPGRVVIDHLRRRVGDGWRDPVVRRTARHLPWAAATRTVAARRRRAVGPEAVWSEWAGRDCDWDLAPALTR